MLNNILWAFLVEPCFNRFFLWKQKISRHFLQSTLFLAFILISAQGYSVPADLDDDGIPNIIEQQYGLNPYDARDAEFDRDYDRWNNLSEFRAGTRLNDFREHPGLLEVIHQKVFASDSLDTDKFFGYSVDIQGNIAVIGAQWDDEQGINAGWRCCTLIVDTFRYWHAQPSHSV